LSRSITKKKLSYISSAILITEFGTMGWSNHEIQHLYKLGICFSGQHQRLDYVLRDTNLGASYLSALTSHTAYWSNYDVAYFVLTRLFHNLGSPANVSQQPQASSEASSVNK
jgi:hypothetical protein